MNFSEALVAMKEGKRVAREGWNGKGMWGRIAPKPYIISGIEGIQTSPLFFELKGTDDLIGPWTIVTKDILAEDWVIVE